MPIKFDLQENVYVNFIYNSVVAIYRLNAYQYEKSVVESCNKYKCTTTDACKP